MGNSKSKKVKISNEQTPNNQKNTEESHERINALKNDVADSGSKDTNGEYEAGESKDRDNASSASTVEVLDDKWMPVTDNIFLVLIIFNSRYK